MKSHRRISRSTKLRIERLVRQQKGRGKRQRVRKEDDGGTVVEVFALEKFIHNQPSNFL